MTNGDTIYVGDKELSVLFFRELSSSRRRLLPLTNGDGSILTGPAAAFLLADEKAGFFEGQQQRDDGNDRELEGAGAGPRRRLTPCSEGQWVLDRMAIKTATVRTTEYRTYQEDATSSFYTNADCAATPNSVTTTKWIYFDMSNSETVDGTASTVTITCAEETDTEGTNWASRDSAASWWLITALLAVLSAAWAH
ncbi:unnamed protein product [Phaeothamnion confervicola]